MRASGYPAIASCMASITRRVKAEQELRASENRLALAARAGSLGMWELDCANERLRATDIWRDLTGLEEPAEGLPLARWLERVHIDDRRPLAEQFARLLAGSVPHFEEESRLDHPRRGTVWLRTTAEVADRGLEAAMRRADQALYEAKREGRNRVRVFAAPAPV